VLLCSFSLSALAHDFLPSSRNATTLSNRPTERQLQRIRVIGNSGTPPENAYPLKLCQGDCDRDEDVSRIEWLIA
jgi:hypothetical protein